MATPNNNASSSSSSSTAGRITSFVVAVTALVGALGGVERIGPFTCKMWPRFPWCENNSTFVYADFWGIGNYDRELNRKLLIYIKDQCDNKPRCSIDTEKIFRSVSGASPEGDRGIRFRYYCGDKQAEGASYAWEIKIVSCPLENERK
jgi:hypothetical protein